LIVNVTEVEQFSALAGNWRDAEAIGDTAASEAFEDELHERITIDEIRTIQSLDAQTGEPSSAETDRVRTVLEKMWTNASARLD
jgi:hypothetical protein